MVEVRLQNDGRVASFTGRVSVDEMYLRRPPFGWRSEGGQGLCTVSVSWGVDVDVALWPVVASEDLLVCRFPLQAAGVTRRNVALSVRGECRDLAGGLLPCEFSNGSVMVDGLDPLPERSMAFIPKLPPQAPARSQILAFDYRASSESAPLVSLDSPRPESAESIFVAWYSPLKGAVGAPNLSVQELLRAVRVVYADSESRDSGLRRVAVDPAVHAVLPAGMNGAASIYPARPRPGQPFALWLTGPTCTYYIADHHDDRQVLRDGHRLLVHARYRADPCGVRPFGNHHALLNMPGLPAGRYTLEVLPRNWETGEDAWYAPRYSLDLIVEGEPASTPVAVAATGQAALLLQALAVLIVIAAMQVRRRST